MLGKESSFAQQQIQAKTLQKSDSVSAKGHSDKHPKVQIKNGM